MLRESPHYQLFAGHVLDVLASLPAASVQTVVTSPPYYGLRDYDSVPQVWGGDPACDHTWQPVGSRTSPPPRDHAGAYGFAATRGQERHRAGTELKASLGAVCACGAWRGELGQEPTVAGYVAHLVAVFAAVRRVLRPDGTLWLNLGDSYSRNGGTPGGGNRTLLHMEGTQRRQSRAPKDLGEKQLLMVPARVALALQDAGWVLRQEIVWAKPAPMPESVRDRCTRAHEMIYMFSPRPRYYYDAAAIAEPCVSTAPAGDGFQRGARLSFLEADGASREQAARWEVAATRNRRDVWAIGPDPYPDAHFATFPPELPRLCLRAGTSAAGQCSACGTSWRRTVAAGTPIQQHWAPGTQAKIDIAQGRHGSSSVMNTGYTTPRITTGWAPACRCNAGAPVPQIVLDPFGGSGTTVAVAIEEGRIGWGIEINPAYLALAEARLRTVDPLFRAAPDPAPWQPALLTEEIPA